MNIGNFLMASSKSPHPATLLDKLHLGARMRLAVVSLAFSAVTLSIPAVCGVTHGREPVQIARHRIDLDFCRDVLAERRETWPKYVEFARRKPDSLSALAREALDIVRYGIVVEPESPDIARMLRIAAQASAGLFVVDRAGGERVSWLVGKERFVYQGQSVHESIVHAGRWLEAFHLAMICREEGLLDALCRTSSDRLRKSSTKHPEYVYLQVDAYRAYWKREDGVFRLLLDALRRTDPQADKSLDVDYTLCIAVPLIEVTARCMTHDEDRFQDALSRSLQLHKEYYSANSERADDRKGFISLALAAMAARAHDEGIPFDVQTPYLPKMFVSGDCFRRQAK